MRTLWICDSYWKKGAAYFWAESREEAERLAKEYDVLDEDTPFYVERVWASNTDPRYRGYVVQD